MRDVLLFELILVAWYTLVCGAVQFNKILGFIDESVKAKRFFFFIIHRIIQIFFYREYLKSYGKIEINVGEWEQWKLYMKGLKCFKKSIKSWLIFLWNILTQKDGTVLIGDCVWRPGWSNSVVRSPETLDIHNRLGTAIQNHSPPPLHPRVWWFLVTIRKWQHKESIPAESKRHTIDVYILNITLLSVMNDRDGENILELT